MVVENDLVIYLDMLGGHSLLHDLNMQDMFLSVTVKVGHDERSAVNSNPHFLYTFNQTFILISFYIFACFALTVTQFDKYLILFY